MSENLRLASLMIALMLAGCASRLVPYPASKAQAALDFVEHKVRAVHPDTRGGLSAESEAALAEARAAIRAAKSDEDVFRIVNTFLVSLHDGHAEVRLSDDALHRAGCLDLPLSWRPEGLVFLRATGRVDRGDRLVGLAGLDEDALLQRFRAITPAENEARLRYQVARRLGIGAYLNALRMIDEADEVAVVIESASGERQAIRLPLEACPPPPGGGAKIEVEVHEAASLAVFRFDRFMYDAAMASEIERFFQAVKVGNIRNIAVDLRGNEGGDSTVAFAFLQYLADVEYRSFGVEVRISDELATAVPALGPHAMSAAFQSAGLPPIPGEAGHYHLPGDLVKFGMLAQVAAMAPAAPTRVAGRHLYLLTDAGTFSSGNLFAILLRDNDIGTLVGEPTGNEVNFNGSELRFPLPGTDYYLNLSAARMTRPDAARGDAPAIEPDVPIVARRSDIVAGRDPQLEYLLGRQSGRNP